MNMKAAIFDMDGTLVDSLMVWDVLWSAMGEKYRNDSDFRPSTEDDKKVRTLILADAMELIHKNYGLGDSGAELLQLANDFMKDFYANTVTLKKDVPAFLKHCKEQGVKMCIASATAPDLIAVALKHCGIESYFSKIFSCAEVGKGKEEPDVFLKACDHFGEKMEETWLFEDSLVAIKTAVKIGMPTVGIYDAYNFGQAEIKELATEYIADGESLLKLIEEVRYERKGIFFTGDHTGKGVGTL